MANRTNIPAAAKQYIEDDDSPSANKICVGTLIPTPAGTSAPVPVPVPALRKAETGHQAHLMTISSSVQLNSPRTQIRQQIHTQKEEKMQKSQPNDHQSGSINHRLTVVVIATSLCLTFLFFGYQRNRNLQHTRTAPYTAVDEGTRLVSEHEHQQPAAVVSTVKSKE